MSKPDKQTSTQTSFRSAPDLTQKRGSVSRQKWPYVVSVFITSLCLSLQVLFGTADGQVIVMDCHGRMLAHVLLHESDGIIGMSWNCPDFLVEDSTESETDADDNAPPQGRRPNLPKRIVSSKTHANMSYVVILPVVCTSVWPD